MGIYHFLCNEYPLNISLLQIMNDERRKSFIPPVLIICSDAQTEKNHHTLQKLATCKGFHVVCQRLL